MLLVTFHENISKNIFFIQGTTTFLFILMCVWNIYMLTVYFWGAKTMTLNEQGRINIYDMEKDLRKLIILQFVYKKSDM